MNYSEKIRVMIQESGGIVTSRELKEQKIPSIYLTRMIESGELVREERGIYRTADGDYDEYYYFQQRYQAAIFSYVSALYLHEYTDIIPQQMEVTVYKGYNTHRFDAGIRVHYAQRDVHQLGAITIPTMYGNNVVAYNLERIICDMIKNRKDIDSELFSKTINRYARDSRKNLKLLGEYAKKMKIQDKVRDIMEVVYE